jgi:hypothetical protein
LNDILVVSLFIERNIKIHALFKENFHQPQIAI